MADNPGKISEVADSISSLLKERGYDHEVLPWEQLAPQLAQFAEMERSMTYVFLSIVIIVAVIGILNTMLMAVYERIKEVGVMAAFGYKPRNIVSLFLQEGLIIGVIGVLAGSILGVGISYYFSVVGITFTGADVVEFMETQVYPRLSMTDVLFPCIFAVGVALIAALYPAYKASSVEPVEALRHV
jgi:putative ABC transport system permease protein